MTAFGEIALVAALAQLTVLPGEKVQFIIAGLATRYRPLLVVGAAGAAFAGWTALEILFGNAIQQALPGPALDAITAALFLLFAVMLVRSAPDGQGLEDARADATLDDRPDFRGPELPLLGRATRGPIGRFVAIFALMAAGEFGDKTQLITIGLAVQYGATPAIWVGEMAVILPVSLANAYLFHRFAHRVDMRKGHFLGAALFAFFGVDTALSIVTGVSVWEQVIGAISGIV
jgi:putative Ca2+/H+ antiporter (TMEM165/GDT1 family)